MKVAVYCRVSTDSQELSQQIESCKKFCGFKGFEFEVFSEIGSGKNFNRPEFYRMLETIRKGDFQGVVCFRFDRLGRNVRDLLDFFNEMENKKVEIFSVNESLDTSTAIGRAVRDIILRMAQLERESISEATKQRLQALKNLGKHLGRPKGSRDNKARKKSGYFRRWSDKAEVNRHKIRMRRVNKGGVEKPLKNAEELNE